MTLSPYTRRITPEMPNLIQGTTPQAWDLRVVQGVHQLFRDVTEPVGLLAMGMGSTAFRGGKLLAQWGLFSGAGWGARLGSSLFGVASEALAFTEVEYLSAKFNGQSHESPWLRQLGSNFWFLGCMRAAGFSSQALGRWVHGEKLLRSPVLANLYQQGGMYAGILAGNGALGNFSTPGDHLIHSLGLLLQFNLAGRLAQHSVGRFLEPLEQVMEQKIRRNETPRVEVLRPQWVEGGMGPAGIQIYQQRKWALPEVSAPRPVHPTVMGVASTPHGEALASFAPSVRLAQEQTIKELLSSPRRGVTEEKVAQEEWLREFLSAHEISSHPYDLKMFRVGHSLAKAHFELTRRMAWDVDEVQLHWSLNPVDIFREAFRGEKDAPFQNTPSKIFDYTSFAAAPEVKLPKLQRLWYDGVQRLIPSRMRQVIQFHPGGRAFLLGMKSGAVEPLTLITTGPASRLLILINEDPAFKNIYFDKRPTETVTMEELRAARNIYTREDLVRAMRIVAEGDSELLQDPLVRDYIEKIRVNPKEGHKLKHPALARILKKRSFDILVDDSDSTYRMLGSLPNFAVFKPASARPPYSLNFVLSSRGRYLDRMANGFFEVLASHLEGYVAHRSAKISAGHLSEDYPIQRFSIEVPWGRYRHEFALPGVELEQLSEKIARMTLPETKKNVRGIYRIDDKGFHLIQPGQRVAVLGDVGCARTYELAKEGHYPIFIDLDSKTLRSHQRAFGRINGADVIRGKVDREVFVQWVEGDWYKTAMEADVVEAFFPLTGNYYLNNKKGSKKFVRNFMEEALHSKLGREGGSVYLLTEVSILVKQMKEIIQKDPTLSLIDSEISDENPPIIGGYVGSIGEDFAATNHAGWIPASWIRYQKKPQ